MISKFSSPASGKGTATATPTGGPALSGVTGTPGALIATGSIAGPVTDGGGGNGAGGPPSQGTATAPPIGLGGGGTFGAWICAGSITGTATGGGGVNGAGGPPIHGTGSPRLGRGCGLGNGNSPQGSSAF